MQPKTESQRLPESCCHTRDNQKAWRRCIPCESICQTVENQKPVPISSSSAERHSIHEDTRIKQEKKWSHPSCGSKQPSGFNDTWRGSQWVCSVCCLENIAVLVTHHKTHLSSLEDGGVSMPDMSLCSNPLTTSVDILLFAIGFQQPSWGYDIDNAPTSSINISSNSCSIILGIEGIQILLDINIQDHQKMTLECFCWPDHMVTSRSVVVVVFVFCYSLHLNGKEQEQNLNGCSFLAIRFWVQFLSKGPLWVEIACSRTTIQWHAQTAGWLETLKLPVGVCEVDLYVSPVTDWQPCPCCQHVGNCGHLCDPTDGLSVDYQCSGNGWNGQSRLVERGRAVKFFHSSSGAIGFHVPVLFTHM